jgi:hypothetical protein
MFVKVANPLAVSIPLSLTPRFFITPQAIGDVKNGQPDSYSIHSIFILKWVGSFPV